MTRDELRSLLCDKPGLAKANPNWREKVHDLLVNTELDCQPLRVIPLLADPIGGFMPAKPQKPVLGKPRKPGKQSGSPLERKFDLCWLAIGGGELVKEAPFHPIRKWRFDRCLPSKKIAFEINGGTWLSFHGKKGGHSTGVGHRNDCEKYLEAALLGWRVIQLEEGQINTATLLRIKNHFDL